MDDADLATERAARVAEESGLGGPVWGITVGDVIEVCVDADRRGRLHPELVGTRQVVEAVGFEFVKAGGVFWEPSGVRKC